MGTWTLWIVFNVGVVVFLTLDLGLFHRRAHKVSVREAALESAFWIAISVAFGFWILFSHGHDTALQFFTGYLIEKSLSVDNIFVFLLVFQYFRVPSQYQHRLLFWGVLGALIMRGIMIAAGYALIEQFEWVLYLFGAFLIFAGVKMFRGGHSVHPEKNPVLRWIKRILPMTNKESGHRLFVREGGRWLVTPLFLVVAVLETTDLVFAIDSIPAVFGVTRDPFLVYSSNICAILGLRALYFLLAGALPFFRYLDDGLAIVLMFVGGKMIVEHWIHISTVFSLLTVGGVITASVLASLFATWREARAKPAAGRLRKVPHGEAAAAEIRASIALLAHPDLDTRTAAAKQLSDFGDALLLTAASRWLEDGEFRSLVIPQAAPGQNGSAHIEGQRTVGIAVQPDRFEEIRESNGHPPLADVPPDQDALEFELHFSNGSRIDILTTRDPKNGGAIARFLEKFGEGIQQMEIDMTNVDRATEILKTRFAQEPVYPATRPGANGSRVNFFLAPAGEDKKVLVELVESSNSSD